jgi:hypothetical protein
MIREEYRWLESHRPGCYALANVKDGTWDTPWAFLYDPVYRDSLGRKNGMGSRWWHIRCNDSNCPALILVNERVILESFPSLRPSPRLESV